MKGVRREMLTKLSALTSWKQEEAASKVATGGQQHTGLPLIGFVCLCVSVCRSGSVVYVQMAHWVPL